MRKFCVCLFIVLIFDRTSSFSFKSGKGKQVFSELCFSSDANNIQHHERHRRKLGGRVPILSRTIPIETEDIPHITIWELEKPSELMEMWWQAEVESSFVTKEKIGDPFGVVMWPGSILASREMELHKNNIKNKTVLVLGAGTGVEAQAAAMLGASKVIATDINKLTLKLLKYGADFAGLADIIDCREFDLFSKDKLPECDIVIAADILYNERLAAQVGVRCREIFEREPQPKLIVTDSQRFHGTDFLIALNQERNDASKLCWGYHVLSNVTGSGVAIDGDQTYDVKTRMLSIGWNT